LKRCRDYVWLYIKHTENDKLVELIEAIRKEGDTRVYDSKKPEKGWDVKVPITLARKILTDGL